MDSLLHRIRRSLAVRGSIGTARLCASELAWRILPNGRRAEAQRQAIDALFDEALGVDTGGIYRPLPDSVIGPNWSYGVNYQAVDPALCLRAITSADLQCEETTFIDLGCGKGRALLIAAAFPFRRIIGVEYCQLLHQVALRNLRSAVEWSPCPAIEVLRMDAVDFPIPDGPLAIFMYNPFSETVMRRVFDNVAASLHRTPRRLMVIYFTPEHQAVWSENGLFRFLQEDPLILETCPSLVH